MPQSTSLFMEFTLTETFAYFGRLLKMTWEEVAARREKLLRLLELPLEDRQVVFTRVSVLITRFYGRCLILGCKLVKA